MIPLTERAEKQIAARRGNYGAKRNENSFPFIARRLQVWFKNNFDVDVHIEDWHVADFMVEFKRGRAEARRAAGVPPNPDDPEDAVAYLQWVEWLFPDADTANMLDNIDRLKIAASTFEDDPTVCNEDEE